jgi:hypothetical protein
MSYDNLISEKKKVKFELKKFDEEFQNVFDRLP